MITSYWCRLSVAVAAAFVFASACSRSAQTYVDRGDAAVARGDAAAAVLEYRNAVEKDPRLASARQRLADLYLAQGNGAAALGEYVRAADLLPTDVPAQLKAGTLLGLARRFEDARARADKALALEPNNVEALVLRANALAGLTDLEGALEQIQQALRLEPTASIQTNLGAIQTARGNMPEAEAAFRQAVAADPTSVTAQVALGQFLLGVGKLADAEVAFKAAVAMQPENDLANRWMATFYVVSGRSVEAEPYFRKVAEVSDSAAARHALTDYYVGIQRPADGIAVLETLSSEPRFWGFAQAKIASIQFAEGDKDDAFRTVDAVIAQHPTMAQARIVRGQLLLAEGRLDEALADGQEAARLDAQNVAAHFLLGAVHERMHDLDAAARSYGQVMQLNPRASSAQLRLALVEMQRNALQAAAGHAEQAVTAQPDDIGAQVVLARALLASGELERSTAITARVLEMAPESPVVQNQAGMLALAKGDKATARLAFEKTLALDGRLTESLTGLVALDIQDGDGQRARQRVDQRLQAEPENSALLALAGRTWAATGDLAKGEELLRRAIDADAANFEAYAELASVYLAQQKMDAAVLEFDNLAVRQRNSVGPQTMAALIVQAQGKEPDAQRRYERIVELDPRAAVASNNLAWMYASRGEQLDRALQLAQAAKAEIPDHPEVNDTLAYVYLKKQLPALAISPLRMAVEKDPNNPSFHYHLGLAYAGTGDKVAAKASLQQALRLRTDFDDAADARRVLETLN